jgi:uncharacterized protein (TIGR02270 family)
MMHVPGFAPREISTLLIREVIEEHAEDAAMLWRLHERGAGSPIYELRDLELLDERIVAHLDGLLTAGAAGLALARRGLADASPSVVFVVAYLAFSRADMDAIRQIVLVALANARLMDALVAALSWLELRDLESPLQLLRRSERAECRRLAVAVTAAHRVQSEGEFRSAATDPDAELRRRALRAIGETKCPNLAPVLRDALEDPDPQCRFWASWSAALFADQVAAQDAFNAGIDDPELSGFAIEIAMRAGDPGWARGVVRSLAKNPSTLRQAIDAAGALGDPTVIPWLLQMTEQPAVAGVAAHAFAMITGVDLEAAAFKQDAPADAPEAHEDDADMRWPSSKGLAAWWQCEQHRFNPGQRYLGGAPVSPTAAVHVLQNGYQRQRRGAAIELARLRKDAILFPITARADWQRRRLGL